MSSQSEDKFSALVGEIYDAALSTDPWPALLQHLSEVLGKMGVIFFARDLKAEEVPGDSVENLDPAMSESAKKYHLSIRVKAPRVKAGAGRAAGGPDTADEGAAEEDETAGARSQSIVLGSFISQDKPTGSLIGVQVAPGHPSAAIWDGATLRRLAAHLRRAFDFHKQFLSINVQQAATMRALDHLPTGVLFVDSRARVLAMNASARITVAEGDGLIVRRNGVYAESSEQTKALRDLIGRAATTGNGTENERGGAMTLDRPSLRRPLWILVVPLKRKKSGEEDSPAVVALFVSDPDRRYRVPAAALQKFYGLTPAETRLLEALVNGMSLEEASEEFRVSKNTLRTQLHQIFRKTDTSRQSEVIKLVLSAPVHMSAAEGPSEGK